LDKKRLCGKQTLGYSNYNSFLFLYPKDNLLSVQKMFLLALFIPIGLCSFSLFEEKESSEIAVSKPIIIEPIVIPNSVKEESNAEILEKLKVATKEVFKNAEPSEEEVAEKVLVALKALMKSREDEKQRVIDEKIKHEKQKKLLRQKEREKREKLERKRERAKKKLLKQKEFVRKKEQKKLLKERAYAKKKELARKKKLQEKRRLVKKRELEKKKALSLAPQITHARVKTVKEGVLLGEQQDIYTLSKEEEKNFHNLEVVSKSKTFTLEDTPTIKSPKQYQGVQNKVKFDELPWVDTLGVINVSKPFLKHQD